MDESLIFHEFFFCTCGLQKDEAYCLANYKYGQYLFRRNDKGRLCQYLTV